MCQCCSQCALLLSSVWISCWTASDFFGCFESLLLCDLIFGSQCLFPYFSSIIHRRQYHYITVLHTSKRRIWSPTSEDPICQWPRFSPTMLQLGFSLSVCILQGRGTMLALWRLSMRFLSRTWHLRGTDSFECLTMVMDFQNVGKVGLGSYAELLRKRKLTLIKMHL